MKHYTLLFLAGMFLSLPAFGASPGWVVGYYDPGYQQLCAVKDLPFSKLSLATVNVNLMGNGKLAADVGDGNLISEFPKLSHAAGCPAILGVLDLNKGTFHPQVINSEKRRKLIAKIVSWVKKYSYDGVDIDWEQPKVESDKKDFVVFSRELRAALPSPRYLLTFDMTRSPLWDLPSLAVIYDFIQFMAYDMHGGWSEHAGYNAPLYLDPRDKDGDWGDSLSVDLDTQWILKAGAPPGQLILGIPFYGHGFSVGLYEKGVNGNASYLPYEEIQRNWISKGWSRRWDKAAKVPYLVHPGEAGVVSYDDAESLQAKCRYALSKGLAGVMIYAVGYDREASGRQPLMDAVAEVLKARH